MAMTFVNGKRVELPDSISREGIIKVAGMDKIPGRSVVVQGKDGGMKQIKPGEVYHPNSRDKLKIVPERFKGGGFVSGGKKEKWKRDLIIDQVADVSENLFKGGLVELDDNCDWVKFNNFKLPDEWSRLNNGQKYTSLMLVFPDKYPELPTNGFYLPSTLKRVPHVFESIPYSSGVYGIAPDEEKEMKEKGWVWFCSHIKSGSWHPAKIRQISDWRKGDNLWDIITLCTDVLTYPMDD